MIQEEILNLLVPLTDELTLVDIKIQLEKRKELPSLAALCKYEEVYESISNEILQLLIKWRSPIADNFLKSIQPIS
jgi:hypothetical protein